MIARRIALKILRRASTGAGTKKEVRWACRVMGMGMALGLRPGPGLGMWMEKRRH